MTTEEIRLGAMSPSQREAARQLYEYSFPVEERRPWLDILARDSDDGRFRLEGIYRGGRWAGMMTSWQFDTFRYIEHLAIDSSMRGAGIGAAVLARLLASDPRPVVLEVEIPALAEDPEMARRRIGFYQRCGFTAFPRFDYVQPPYLEGLPAVPMMLMSSDDGGELPLMAATIHRQVYGVG